MCGIVGYVGSEQAAPILLHGLSKLEDELGVKLFDRTVQPVCPTPIGQKVIDQARVILAQAAQVKEIISEDKQSLSGVFRLGVLPTIAPYLLPRFFPQLMEKYPELDIRVTEMKTQDIQQALHAGDLDAGIIASKLEDTFLTEETLFYEQFYAYVSRKEPSFKHDVIRTSDIWYGNGTDTVGCGKSAFRTCEKCCDSCGPVYCHIFCEGDYGVKMYG